MHGIVTTVDGRPAARAVRVALAAALALACTGAPADRAHASPLDLFGFGGRSPALAGAGVATTVGFDAVYLNPAGLADVPGKRLTVGTMHSRFYLDAGDERADVDPATGLVLGGALPIPLGGALKDRVVLGVGFHVPTESLNRARHPLPGVPTFVLLESRAHVVGVQAGLGVVINPRWRAGLGVLALGQLGGAIDIGADAAGRFSTSSEQQLLTQMAPVAGARYLMRDRGLSLGLVFRGESRSTYDITITNNIGESLPLSVPTIRIAGTSQYDPLTVALEAAWQLTPALAVTGQVAYQRWSAFPRPTENPVASGPPPESPEFHDTAVPRLALEWTPDARPAATRITLRGGYALQLSPAPEADGAQSLLDNHRHVIGAGVGLEWPGTSIPLHLDLWAQAHVLAPRSHTKDPAKLPPDEMPMFDTLATGGTIAVGGITMGVDL